MKYLKTQLLALSLMVALSSAAQYSCQELKQQLGAAISGPSINNNAKSDTFDIEHYHLELDFSNLPQRLLKGKAVITVKRLIPSTKINLDLLLLQVDSVLQDGQSVNFSHNDTILSIDLVATNPVFQPFDITVFYEGAPIGDGSGWGGWHHDNPYFFNLGVGFAADPHTYGRAWHPCFDNFVEKATYDFEVLTRLPRRPYCNGERLWEVSVAGDSIVTKWQMTDPIPTYLASVAVNNYIEIEDSVQGLQKAIPIQLMARPGDSAATINSFGNLKGMLHSFEKAFGPYHWQRIGYAMTTVGAMEHATSIHFPRTLLNPGGEDIIAHELAHHWFGNLVTCESDLDMWINEGLAEYSSHLYTEDVYDRQRYMDVVRANAYQVLTLAHRRDDGYKALYGNDHEYVYGFHVYQKGAMVGHNMRGYLGDSLFFNGITALLNNNKYLNLNTAAFRDQLSAHTGISMNDFFQDWIYNPGYPSIWTDSINIAPGNITVRLVQGTYEAPVSYSNMPVDVSFFDDNGQKEVRRVVLNNTTGTYNFQNIGFTPTIVTANHESLILTGDAYDEYDASGPFLDDYSEITLTPYGNVNSDKIISVHHWDGPGGQKPSWADFNISKNRFWSVHFSDRSDRVKGRIVVNGSPNGFDQDLLLQTGDSLAVLYRGPDGGSWQLWPYQSKTIFGAAGSIQGFIELDSVQAGDYVLANTKETIGLSEVKHDFPYGIYPNPADSFIQIETPVEWRGERTISIFDRSGKVIYRKRHILNDEALKIELEDLNTSFIILQIGKLSTLVKLQ